MGVALNISSPVAPLRTPVLYWTEVSSASAPLQELIERVESQILRPMAQSRDEVEWVERMEASHDDWLRLRLELVLSILPELELRDFETMAEESARLPITLLPATTYGAACYAIDLIAWLSTRLVKAAIRRKNLDLERVEELVEVMAVVELCWLTLLSTPKPIPEVAEAAAWEAYSYTRPLAGLILGLGLDTRDMPMETPEQTVERAEAMLDRLSARWTKDDDAALAGARRGAGTAT